MGTLRTDTEMGPICAHECMHTSALRLGWSSRKLMDQLCIPSLLFFPLLFNSNMKEHQDLYSVFRKLCSVLFYICPGLDSWRTLLFCLFYVFRLQYFSPSFSVLLMNLSLMMKIACCEKIPVGFIEEARQVGCQIFPQLS